MYTPMQSLYIKGSAGDPLPMPWEALDVKGTLFLRGQLVLIVAPGGCGKSAFILSYALQAQVPTLYFSADSDAFTQLSRTVSILTGQSTETSENDVRSGTLAPAAQRALDNIPIRFKYEGSPNLDQIEASMLAYDEVYGDFPSLVVIDNLTNVNAEGGGGDDEASGQEALMDYLNTMARSTGSCVVAMHHPKAEYNDGNKPIPLSGVKNQITRVPALVLTMHRTQTEFGDAPLNISTVKNRGRRFDPSGYDYVSLRFDGDHMQIRDFA